MIGSSRAVLARNALQRARQVLSSVDPDEPRGDVFELFGACREAVYWALTIKTGEGQTVVGAWRCAEPALLGPRARDWHRLLAEDGYLALEGDEPAAWVVARDALAFATGLVARCDPQGELRLRQGRQRVVRLAAAMVAALSTLWGTWWLVRGPDLARGKTWRASSAYGGYLVTGSEQKQSDVGVFFHTNHEADPWVEVDLGAETTISEVMLVNREVVAERAVPLVVEVRSSTVEPWKEVARRELAFSTWSVGAVGVRAQLVRVRAPRTTWLHLKRVEIR